MAASADHDEAMDQVGAPVRRVRVECGALRLEGDVVVDMPANHSRILDLLNRPGAFLNVREGERHHLVCKSRDHARERARRRRLEAEAIAPRAMTDAGERALLVGLSLGGRGRARTESSLEELALLARQRGRAGRGHAPPGAGPARPRHPDRAGQGRGGEAPRARRRRRTSSSSTRTSRRPSSATSRRRSGARRSTARSSSSTSSPAARARARAGCRSSWRSSTTCCRGWPGKGVLLSRLGGGIGTRGPGETKLETDRRRIRQRIQAIRREIEHVRRERHDPARGPGAARRAGGRPRGLHERRQVDALQRPDARPAPSSRTSSS